MLLSFLLALGSFMPGYAQVQRDVVISLTDSIHEVHNEELKDVTIKIENKGTSVFKGAIHLYCSKGARVATKPDMPVEVAPGKSLFVPAKLYIGRTTLAGDITYSAQLFNDRRTKIAETTASLRLTGSKLMQAFFTNNEIIMPGTGKEIQVMVQVSNRGNTAQEANIVIAYPTELHDPVNKAIKLTVPPFTDTLISFPRKVTKDMANLEYMDITVYGVYSSGDYFSIASASVQSLKSKKRFGRKMLNNYVQQTNYISLGTQNSFSDNESYFLRGKGDYAFHDGNITFSLNIFKWKSSGMPTLINDTWLGLEYRNFGLRVGNIIQNGELSYNGRGAEMYYYTDSARQNKIYAGYLDKSFNLINTQQGSASFGRAAWVGMLQRKGKLLNNTTISYDEDKYALSKSVLAVNDATWHINDLLFASAKIGIANSASSVEEDKSRQSFSIGGSINGSLSKVISISSDNLYASGYYPGTRRGTLSLNERINFRLKQTTLSAGYMYNHIDPRYFSISNISFRSNNKSSTAELSVSRSFKNINLALTSQYYREDGNWYYISGMIPGSMSALRLSASASMADIATRQNIMLRTDVGRYTTSFMSGYRWQFRANLAYSYRFLRLAANMQKGNFYLSEAFQEFAGGQSDLRVNITSSVSKGFFNNKLRADAGIAYYKDFYISSVMYNGSLNCNLGTTHLFATIQYNTFVSSTSYRNIQFGITQLLPQARKEEVLNKGTIRLLVFYDVNGNGSYDAQDSVAKGYMGSINKVLFVTDKEGRIAYNRLPDGEYNIYFPTQKGWYGPDQFVVVKGKEENELQVALRQTGTISGGISYEFNELLSVGTTKDLAGQTITATDKEGKTFETKTDDNGSYVIYLPTGSYTITVNNLPAQIEVIPSGEHKQPLEVRSGQSIDKVDFLLKVKQRKIEVKKFGQN